LPDLAATHIESGSWPVNIGVAARQSGVSAKMIRHYESLSLLPAVNRTDSGYRQYTQADVHTLRFIRRCRELGFPMKDIASLVNLWHDQHAQQRQRAGHCPAAICTRWPNELPVCRPCNAHFKA
jgi:MerR family copper efflux transcriptional regulator